MGAMGRDNIIRAFSRHLFLLYFGNMRHSSVKNINTTLTRTCIAIVCVFSLILTFSFAQARESPRDQLQILFPELTEVQINILESRVSDYNIPLKDTAALQAEVEIARLITSDIEEENESNTVSPLIIESFAVTYVENDILTAQMVIQGGSEPISNLSYHIDFFGQSDDESKSLIREHVAAFDDRINLAAGERLVRDITVPIPPALSGDITIIAVLGSAASGRVIGTTPPASFTSFNSTGGVIIDEGTCYLTLNTTDTPRYNLTQGVDIDPSETIALTCTIENTTTSELTVTPRLITHKRSLLGDMVDDRNGSESITIGAMSTTTASFPLTHQTVAQSYRVLVDLTSDTGLESTAFTAHYVISGNSATIQDLSVTNTSPRAGEEIEMILTYTGRADVFPESRFDTTNLSQQLLFANIQLQNTDGQVCGDIVRESLFTEEVLNTHTIKYTVTADCDSFTAVVFLDDNNGNTLATNEFTFNALLSDDDVGNETMGVSQGTFPVMKALLYATAFCAFMVFALLMYYRQRKNALKLMGLLLFAGMGVFGGLFVSPTTAEAGWTQQNFYLGYDIRYGSTGSWVDHTTTGNFASPANGDRIMAGQSFSVHGHIATMACSNSNNHLRWTLQIFNDNYTTNRGPYTYTGTDPRWTVANLPPGTYRVMVLFEDSRRHDGVHQFRGPHVAARYFWITVDPPPPPSCSISNNYTCGGWGSGYQGSTCQAGSFYGSRVVGGNWQSCTMPQPINGTCGSAHNTTATSFPNSSQSCSSGNRIGESQTATQYSWQCQGSNGGSTASCQASRPIAVNGTCGSAHNTTATSFPNSSQSCSPGNRINTSETATQYSWQCQGSNGGSTASCQASRPTASFNLSSCEITSGNNSCPATIGWTSSNASSPTITQNGTSFSTNANDTTSRELLRGTNTFVFRSNGTQIALNSVNVDCDSNANWNGSSCVSTVTLDVTSGGLIRSGDTSEVDFSASGLDESGTSFTCSFTGGGLHVNNDGTPREFVIDSDRSLGTEPVFTTNQIQNFTVITLTCVDDNNPTNIATSSTNIEVIPAVTEI
jgi:hypothetical protein